MQEDPPIAAPMSDDRMMSLLDEVAGTVRDAVDGCTDWRAPGDRPGQYALDLVADEAACRVLHRAGLAVMSEESGLTGGVPSTDGPESPWLVVVDPIDGSTNASLRIPWYATSLCVLDADGPRVALVVNQATGTRYQAVRGGGAHRDGRPVRPSGCADLAGAVIGISGLPAAHPGWGQYRALGAAALDLCAVAEGCLDGYRTVGRSALSGWDYLGALLVCLEAGAAVAECDGRQLVVRDDARRRPLAAATAALRDELLAARV
ncbi:MAG: inositol monophosphatase family protein [Acidimicrobiales bacterium]